MCYMRPVDRKHAALVTGLACLLHAPSFFRPFADGDEGSYAGIACRLLAGGQPYHDGVENKFPGVFYIYKSVFAVFGRYNMLAIHVLVTLCAIATALVVGAIARRLAGERAGRWAAICYAIFSAAYTPKMLAGNTEMFAVLPGAIAVWCYLRARDGRLRWYVAAGAAGAVALLCKQVALATFAALLADRGLAGLRTPLRALRDLALLVVGFAVVVVAMAMYLRRLGVWDDAVFWTWTYVLHYYLPAGTGDHGFLFNLATCLVPYAIVVSPMLYLAYVGRDRALAPLYWWLAANVTAALFGGRMYNHYFLLMVPALATLAGIGAARWLTAPRQQRLVVALGVVCTGMFVAAIVFEPLTEQAFVPDPDYREAAHYVAERTRPDEGIFVWGWFPPLYQAADRCPSTRFVYTVILVGKGASGGQQRFTAVPEAWDMVMHDLEAAPPPYILDVSTGDYGFDFPPEGYPQLWQFISSRYQVATTVAGVRIFRRNDRV
jgi:4-amino-4-deoxy-L-arabinose transferase-like glycosyltransferase